MNFDIGEPTSSSSPKPEYLDSSRMDLYLLA